MLIGRELLHKLSLVVAGDIKGSAVKPIVEAAIGDIEFLNEEIDNLNEEIDKLQGLLEENNIKY
jgi:hypothetical protein